MRRSLEVLAVVLVCSRGASAQEAGPAAGNVQAARALFDDARRDEQAARWTDALVKFKRILETKKTASVLFHVAYCEEKLGEFASAYEDYGRALELARSTGGPDRKLIIEQSADSMKVLLPQIPEVTLQLPREVESPRVTVDNTVVPPEKVAAPLRVNPGLHTISVSAPGWKPFVREVSLKPYERHTISTALERASSTPPTAPPVAPVATGPIAPGPIAPPAEAPTKSGGGSAVPWVVGGVSVGLAGAAVGFFLAGQSRADDLDECRRNNVVCDRDSIDKARTRNYALAGAAGVLALVGGGVTLVLALSKNDDAPAGAKAASGLVLTPGGVGWASRF